MKNLILLSVLAFLFSIPVQGQFLKKLQQKVEQRVEDVVTTKVADKAASEASKSMDHLLNFQLKEYGILSGFEQVDPAEIPDSYSFDYTYTMKMETRNGEILMSYLLKKDAPYFGMKMGEAQDMYVVMDPSTHMTVMYINSEGNKFISATKMPEVDPDVVEEYNSSEEDFNFKKIGNKTILGYECQGFQSETKEGVYTFYITRDAGFSFNDIYKNPKAKMPKNIDPQWMDMEKGLMMQMIVEGNKKAKDNMTMTCVGIENKNFTLNKSEYQSLAGN